MNKFPSQTTTIYDTKSSSNPSLITAGLPSGSIMTSRLIQPSSTTKQNYYLNQNRATDTQPISSNSQKSDTSQSITLSHRTTSDIYLNLSRKDIDDLMTALHTLAQHVQNDMDENRSHPFTMFHSKSTNHTMKKSSTEMNPSRYSIRNKRRRSLSSDYWFDHHHVINRHYLNLVEEFQHQLYDMKRKQERRILRQLQYDKNHFNHSSSYPSYSSNAILYGSTIRPRQTYNCSRQYPSTKTIPSLKSLSSYILDQFIYINQNEPESNIRMLPQQPHSLQILQNSHISSFMSIDSLNTKDILCTAWKPYRLQKSDIDDQMNFNKIDVATQWSLQILTPKSVSTSTDDQEHSKSNLTPTNSTILTELSQSRTTIATNNSAVHTPIQSFMDTSSLKHDQCKSSLNQNDEHDLTKSETERFLTSLNLSTCKCFNTKLPTIKTNAKHSLTNDDDNDLSVTSLNKKKIKRTTIKLVPKRPRHHPSKSSKNNPTTKRFRSYHHSPSNNRLMTLIQSLKTTDLQEDSSFDFFDVDTIFSDVYDRFFSDTIISEK